MKALDFQLPWDGQPQGVVGINRANPLGAVTENLWVPTDLSGVALGLGTRTPPHADMRLGTRNGRIAITNNDATEVGGSASIAGLGVPLTIFAQFYVDAAPGFVTTIPIYLGGTIYDYCYIGCGSSSFLSGYIRYSGSPQVVDIILSGGTFGKLLSCVFVIRSETDYQFWCNGQTATGTASPGTPTNQLNTVYGTHRMNGAVLMAGYSRTAIPADYALWLSNNPDAWLDLVEPARIWVPFAGASGYFASLAEAASAADSLSVSLGVFPSVSETASGADSAAAVKNSNAAVSETISPADSSTSVYGVTSITSEAASASDSLSEAFGVSGAVAETLSRTNYVPNSEATGATVGVIGSGGAIPTNWQWNGAAGLTREVVAVGTLSNGNAYIDLKLSGTNSSGSTVFPDIYVTPPGSISATLGDVWVASAYVKIIAGSSSGFSVSGRRNVHLSERSTVHLTSSSVAVDSNRGTIARTFNNAATTSAAVYVDMSVAGSATVDMTVRISAPQLERGIDPGPFATAYIPTTSGATTVTTPSDVASQVYGVTLTDSEAASGADSVSQTYGVTLTQTDSASASDSANTTGGSDVPVTVTESTTASETQSNVTDFPHTVSESTSPTDSPSAVTDFSKTVTESTTASDTQSVTLQLFMVLAELAAAADAASMNLAAFPSISEPANADDFVSNSAAYTLSISEATSSTDQVISIFGYLRSVAESVGATDFASMILNAVAAAALYTDILDIDGRMYLVAYDGRRLLVPDEVREAIIAAEVRTTRFVK